MIALARGILYAEVLLSTLYIVSFKLTFVRLIGVTLILLVLFVGLGGVGKIRRSTMSLMRWAMALVVLRLIVDSTIHFTAPFEATNHFLRQSVVILMLPVFERIGSERIKPDRTLMLAAIPAAILGFLQIYDPAYTIPELIPANAILITEGITESYIRAESRIVGPYSIAIGFALFLGMLAMVVWSRGLMSGVAGKPLALIALAAIAVLLVATQTRSAIYGVIPAVVVGFLMVDPKRIGRWFMAGLGIVVIVVGYSGYEAFVSKHSARSTLEMDANTYYKITANLYGTYAALMRDPLFGVEIPHDADGLKSNARKQHKELIKEGYQHLGRLVDSKQFADLKATNHNMLAFYLRHYGLVGFTILLVMLWKIHRKIAVKQAPQDRFMLYGVMAYFLQYSLLHNSEILETLIIWALLAVGREQNEEEAPDGTGERSAMRLQRA